MKVDELLNDRHITFERLYHRTAYTARRLAQMLHVANREVAKTVLLRTSDGYKVIVLPANRQVDLAQVRQWLGDECVEIASESEMDQVFPDCERGAMPPFGSLYHLDTLVDETLAEDDQIVFEAQSHEQAIRMAYRDFEALEHPHRGHFACKT